MNIVKPAAVISHAGIVEMWAGKSAVSVCVHFHTLKETQLELSMSTLVLLFSMAVKGIH